jgi:hypothetical protein
MKAFSKARQRWGNPLPLASIIINNYNYGRFLSQAIDSALSQTYHPVEVIVVDDGSTDDSRSIIAGFGNQIIPEYKQNGGQASAFNAGLACSRGEVIIFLDADDLLLPNTVAEVVEVFRDHPGVAKVQYRLEVIEASGARTGRLKPLWHQSMPAGDLRAQVLAFPDDIHWQPTSGNAFPAWVLHRIFPIPEQEYRICADYYLSNLPPLFGTVVSLNGVGGYYRVHGTNNHHTSTVNLEQTRQIITRTLHTHSHIKTFANALELPGFPGESAEVPAVTFLAHRMVSLKLDPQRHPIPADRLWWLFTRGIRASFGRFDRPWPVRTVFALWFLTMLFAPKTAVRWLAGKFFNAGSKRQRTNQSGLHRG